MRIPRNPVKPVRIIPPRIEKLTLPPDRRIIVISDVHGNLAYLRGLLAKVNFSTEDVLIIVGDLLEKGPHSLKTLQYVTQLAKTHTVHLVSGNCDWWVPLMYTVGAVEGNLWYINNKPFCLARQMCEELGIEVSYDMDYIAMRDTIAAHYAEEFALLRAMPEILETGHYTFVHGGLPEGDDPQEWDAWHCMKYDNFMATERRFPKWVIVGHWPVMLYRENVVCANPVFDPEKKIISIDGGCVLKDDGQLNALIIPYAGSEDFSFVAYDPFPTATVLSPQAASAHSWYIRWGDAAVEVLEDMGEFSRIRHRRTGYEMDVLTKYLYPDGFGGYTVNDCTDYVLPLAPGDRVSIVEETGRGYFVKHNGVSGWYFGALEKDGNDGND